jgi:response regulator of citrate/malate metabolism
MGLGSGIRDPGSGIQKKLIPDPGSRGQKGTGSRIRIRNTAYFALAEELQQYRSCTKNILKTAIRKNLLQESISKKLDFKTLRSLTANLSADVGTSTKSCSQTIHVNRISPRRYCTTTFLKIFILSSK